MTDNKMNDLQRKALFQSSPNRFGMNLSALFPDRTQRLFGVEVGVHQGLHSLMMLRNHPALYLLCVDLWEKHVEADTGYLTSPGTLPQRFADIEQAKAWRMETMRRLAQVWDRVRILHMSSKEAGERLCVENKDGLGVLDFVYIDGDHSYEGCRDDLRIWYPLIRSGGIIAGHDYGQFQGVTQAVDEFFAGDVVANQGSRKQGTCWMHIKE